MEPFDEMNRARRGRRVLTLAASATLLAFVALMVVPSLLPTSDGGDGPTGEVASVMIEESASRTQLVAQPGASIETFEVFGGKNPFQRPLPQPTATTVPTTTVPGSGSGSGSGGDTGSGSGSGTGSGSGAGQTSTPTTSTTAAPQAPNPVDVQPTRGATVAMLDIFDDTDGTKAQIRVNSTAYRVGEGDTFAGSFRVVSLDLGRGCGQFLFGDSSFELCRGQEILK